MDDNFKVIAYFKGDFPTKFGIPRQSGIVPNVKGRIVFTPEYRNEEALRGLYGYSHLWILWKFSQAEREEWSPTVRPPRLGGNKRVGVFATRSPFRPNPIGLSSVKLERIIKTDSHGTVIEVSGADLMDGTPIYDIKPYIPYTDSHPDALGGFSSEVYGKSLNVIFPENLASRVTKEEQLTIEQILSNDPRPAYQKDSDRVYSFEYADFNIKFKVDGDDLIVVELEKI